MMNKRMTNGLLRSLGLKVRASISAIAPLLIVSFAFPSSSLAATLARVQGDFAISNFSHVPSSVASNSTTSTLASTGDKGAVKVTSDASALFVSEAGSAQNSIFAQLEGTGVGGSGQAMASAFVLGTFELDADTLFSFDWTGLLDLFTSIDDPAQEAVVATGEINLLLINDEDESILDYFTLTANLDTPGDNDVLAGEASDGFSVDGASQLAQDFEGLEEAALAQVQGTYQRRFDGPMRFRLLEVKSGEVRTVPEPTSLFVTLAIAAVPLAHRSRRCSRAVSTK